MPFCSNCGAEAGDKAVVCVKCGVALAQDPALGRREGKDWLSTLLLCFFVGVFGIHRFYTGSTGIGVAQLLTGGGCGIWVLIDFIIILTGAYREGDGRPLVKN